MAAELFCPETDGLVRDDDPTCCQQIIDHTQTERKTKIKPDGVGNHFTRNPVAAIKGISNGLCNPARSHWSSADRLTLRYPLSCRGCEKC